MKLLDSLRFRLATLFRRSQLSTEMEDELRSHIQHRADDLERTGLSRAEAERRARLEFGGQTRFKEESLEAAGGTFIDSLARDIVYAFRMLRKSPGFTAVAVVTLALGIGANAVAFSMMNALVIRPPLSLPQSESLYTIQRSGSDELVRDDPSQSYPDYLDLRDRNRSFDGLAGFNVASAGLDAGDNPTTAWVLEVTGNYFDVLHIQPYLGRFIHASDEHGPNSVPYIVLSYPYWHGHFNDDRSVVGRTVQLNKHPFTILGVAPSGFHGNIVMLFPDFFVPMVDREQIEGGGPDVLNARGDHWVFMTVGHLKSGVTPAQAVADLNSIGAYLEKTYPQDDGHMNFSLARPSLYGDYMGRPVRAFMTGLMLLAGLILLAACTNLGSLFAARAADRSREIALRLALGSSRARILQQLFTEAVLISLIGGAVGVWASVLLLQWLSAWKPIPGAPVIVPVNPDAYVYGVALLLSVASGFLFGAVPARRVLRTDPYGVIKSGAARASGPRITSRDLLLGVQIAICAVLVTSSLVAVRGLARSLHSNFGFEPRHALLVDTDLNMAGYHGEAVPTMQKRMLNALETIPGVTSVGSISNPLPLMGRWNDSNVFTDQTTDLRPTRAAADVVTYSVSPEYFHAAGTALLAGRAFSWNDDEKSPRVAVVNREFGSKIFGSPAKALGGYFKLPNGARVQVVGVVENGKHKNINEDPQPAMFFPLLQAPANETCMVVRSSRDPQQLTTAITSTIRGLDGDLPADVQSWTEALQSTLFAPRVATVSLGVLGVMGAMLAVTGIFGLATYSVSKRKRELGIRIALGARRREVVQAALGRAVKLLLFGSAAGLLLGLLATRVLAVIVFQATPRDPLVLAGVVLVMMFLGLIATWIPAQRAMSIDPSILMREE
jgi:predicted permease